MKALTLYSILLGILFSADYKAQPKQFDRGIGFGFHLSYRNSDLSDNDEYPLQASFVYSTVIYKESYTNTEYYFYDDDLDDTLKLVVFDFIEPFNLNKGTAYEIHYTFNPGWPSTYSLIIKKGDNLVFVGITDWELNKHFKIDSSLIKVEFSEEFAQEADTTQDCYKKITPVSYKFTLNNQSVCLRQGESKIINGIKIYCGIARKVDYDKCFDAGLNSISFLAVNQSIK